MSGRQTEPDMGMGNAAKDEERAEQLRLADLTTAFEARYGIAPEFISRAPGRVNLIGEHTDYNGGFVLPVAINRTVLLAVASTLGNEIHIFSQDYQDTAVFKSGPLEKAPEESRWSNYIRGVAWALGQRELLELERLPGAVMLLVGNVPQGAGLSSSAAVEVATALALFRLAGVKPERSQLALACQLAENSFVGANTGIMDQFISALGQPDSALLIDTRSLAYRAVPLGFAERGWKLVAVDSAVPHRHDASGYNQRRAECETAARLLSQLYGRPENLQLRDFTLAEFEAVASQLPETPARRARHVITEDARTLRTVELLEKGFSEQGAIAEFGQLLRRSHESLRDDFQVTVPQVDLLVELAWQLPGVIGARMTGGGFGGCTVNVVEEAALETFRQQVVEVYRQQTGLAATMYVFDAIGGGSILT
jgi:galactokinase